MQSKSGMIKKSFKILMILTTLCLTSNSTFAQNKTFGIGVAIPNPNAALHVESPTNNQGFLMPKLTTAQRTTMSALLGAGDEGLLLYDKDFRSTFQWNGFAWLPVAGLRLPYQDSIITATGTNNLFTLKYNNAEPKRVMRIESLNSANGSSALSVLQQGTGIAGFFQINNPASGGTAVYGATNSNLGGAVAPVGVYGESTGTGSLGGAFRNSNILNLYPALYAETNGTGSSFRAQNIGTRGNAGLFLITNAANDSSAIYAETLASSANSSTIKAINKNVGFGRGVHGIAAGGNGFGVLGEAKTSSFGIGVLGYGNASVGSGFAGSFEVTNPAATGYIALKASTTSTSDAARIEIFNNTSSSRALAVNTNGTGAAGDFRINNGTSSSAALYSNTDGTGAAILGETSTGYAALHGYAHGVSMGVSATTDGTAPAGNFNVTNVGSSAPGVFASTDGTGAAVVGQTSTGFTAVYGRREGATNGNAGNFQIVNAGNSFPSLDANTIGTGSAANFSINNPSSSASALNVITNGTGSAGDFSKAGTGDISTINSYNTANGAAGNFQIINAANSSSVIYGSTDGTGNTLHVDHTGASGNLALFQNGGTSVARIDKTGQGFFNGGTVSTGADVAEMFDVEGDRNAYEPGDVLVISENTDRTVEISSVASSTKVLGVYATKPGVILTKKGIDENLDELVPMGVVGVIPTKVCLENGPIKRGDLLVTASKKGHAMKAIPVDINGVLFYPTGAILGKALENFDSKESGIIEVFVNVK